jgi:hypothetical protein
MSVPNKASSVVAWRVIAVEFYHLVEVFKSKIKAISSYLFSDRAKVMQCTNVGRL